MSKDSPSEWIDPRPQYPHFGSIVMVKRANGREERMTFERGWDGCYWRSFPGLYRDSIAASEIVGWRYPPASK